ncbi:MAG: hydantoinase B/oxoprolinase family protein, partial [Proteobacteria bacterium]|nr:hydantoinase B/oxoprolinase family protein [Pseudomonadota bacterium]MBU1583799.1 hydantoinase B/oxoprolinase family protein [Pseudomonadota bacterium]
IRSQVAANHVCSQKIIEMMEDEGLDTLDDLADEIIDRTEISMRAAIEKIPDGVYDHTGIIEGAGSKPDIPIKLSVQVAGSKIHVDFAGSSKQVPWGVNVVYNFTYAYVFMAIKSAFDPGVPINEGAIRPITMSAPQGSIVNCTFPAAVAARMVVGHFMTEMVFNALAKAAPDNIIAGSGGTPAQTNIFHGSFANGKPWHTMIIRGGGMGASSRFDGHHCAIFPANGANTPVEILESDTSMMVESRGLIEDSGGPGKHRGGLGRQMIIRSPINGEASCGTTSIAVQAGRYIYPPEGMFGGKNGSLARFQKNGENADPSGLTFMEPGDRISFISAGGGGYGDPFERDPKAVEKDVQYGYVSIEKAKSEYGVVIEPESLELDLSGTQQLRGKNK